MKINLDPFSPVMIIFMIWAAATGLLSKYILLVYSNTFTLSDRAFLYLGTIMCLILAIRAFFVELRLTYDGASLRYRVKLSLTILRGSFSCLALSSLYLFTKYDLLGIGIFWIILAPFAAIEVLNAFKNWNSPPILYRVRINAPWLFGANFKYISSFFAIAIGFFFIGLIAHGGLQPLAHRIAISLCLIGEVFLILGIVSLFRCPEYIIKKVRLYIDIAFFGFSLTFFGATLFIRTTGFYLNLLSRGETSALLSWGIINAVMLMAFFGSVFACIDILKYILTAP